MKNIILAVICAMIGACAGELQDPDQDLNQSQERLVTYQKYKPKKCTAQAQAVLWEEGWYREQGLFVECKRRELREGAKVPGLLQNRSYLFYYDCYDLASGQLMAQLDFGDLQTSEGLLEDEYGFNEYSLGQDVQTELPVSRGTAFCSCVEGCYVTHDKCAERPEQCRQ